VSYGRLIRWEKRIVEYEGSIVVVEYSRGYYRCPLCEDLTLFASEKDLMRHLLAHAIGSLGKRKDPPSRWR